MYLSVKLIGLLQMQINQQKSDIISSHSILIDDSGHLFNSCDIFNTEPLHHQTSPFRNQLHLRVYHSQYEGNCYHQVPMGRLIH